MAITYHAGRRIQCLSTDTSTTSTTLVDDTSSTYTVTKSTTGSWASYSSVGNYTSDLTGNETEYVIKYKLNIGAIAYHSGGSEPRECRHNEHFTENGTANSQSAGTNYIRFGIETVPWQTDGFLMTVGNSGGATTARFSTYTNSNIPTGDYWIKIVRDATTVTIGIYSNSDYSTLIEEQSVTRVPTGIRYFKMDSHNNYSGFVGGGVTATVTDITISTLSTTAFPSTTLNTSQSGSRLEVTDTRKIYYGALPSVTFEDNFDENTSWTQAGSPNTEIVHDYTTDNRIEFTNQRDSFLYKSMGITLSDKFVIQFTHSLTSNPTLGSRYMLFEVTAGTSEPRLSTQDALGVVVAGASQNLYRLAYKDGSGGWTQIASTEDISQGETKYLRLIRDGTDWTIEVYTNSDYSDTPYSFTTTIPSTVTGLSYAMFGGDSGEANSWTCWVDDLKVYDGVTSTTDLVWTEEV